MSSARERKGYPLLPDYLALCKQRYDVSTPPLDFDKASEGACKTINTWVEEKTQQKIQELIKPNVLTPLTRRSGDVIVVAYRDAERGDTARMLL